MKEPGTVLSVILPRPVGGECQWPMMSTDSFMTLNSNHHIIVISEFKFLAQLAATLAS